MMVTPSDETGWAIVDTSGLAMLIWSGTHGKNTAQNKVCQSVMKKIILAAVAVFLLLFIIFLVADDSGSRNRIVLITIDTVRYDHLGTFGYPKDTSPNIDRLALSGVKFTNCYTAMPTTDPSHVSILTSSYPRTHGVIKNGMEITNPDVLCMAKWLKRKGYATAAITAKVGLDPNILKLEGFDHVEAPQDRVLTKTAEEIYSAADAFIGDQAGDFFLWVHFFDPHAAYQPPAPYNSLFNNEFKGYVDKPHQFFPEGTEWTGEEIDYNISLYDGEIRYMDYHIGKLLDRLYEQSPDAPFIILAADHGETLGELQGRYGYVFDHGKFLYNREIKIPLVMSWNGKLPEGKVVDSLTESIDIAPTIIDLLFEEKLSKFWGSSLRGLIFDNSTRERNYAFTHRKYFFQAPKPYLLGEQFAVISQDYKLVYHPLKSSELYHIDAEELPRNNLAARRPDVVAEMLKELGRWKAEHEPAKVNYNISVEKRKQLKALGYVF